MLPVTRSRTYSDVNFTTLLTTVNAAITALTTEAVTEAKLGIKRTRELTIFEIALTIANRANAAGDVLTTPRITSLKGTITTSESSLAADISTLIAAAPVPTYPSAYAEPQVVPYWHKDRPFWRHAVLVPVLSAAGSAIRNVHAVTNPVLANPLAYTILPTDEIIAFTTGAGNVTPTNLPAAANSAGRKLTFFLAATAGGAITITGDLVNAAGTAVASVSTAASQYASVSVECDGVKWYVRETQTVTAGNKSVKSITTAGAPLAYNVLSTDQILECTTDGAFSITATLEAVGAGVKGRVVTFTYQTQGGTGTVIVAGAAATDIIAASGQAVASITLNAIHQTVTLICDGNHWYAIEQATTQSKVTALTGNGGADLAYGTVKSYDQMISCTTNGVGNITMSVPAVTGQAGRKLVIAHSVDGGGEVWITPTTLNSLRQPNTNATTKISLTAIAWVRLECDGTYWWVTGSPSAGVTFA